MYKLTKKGQMVAKLYIEELEAKRKEILDAKLDTDDETNLPTIQDIEADINFIGVDEEGDYYNGWGVTDNYNADAPIGLKLNIDFFDTEEKQKNKEALKRVISLEEIFPEGASSEQLTRFGWLLFSCDEDTKLYEKWQDVPLSVKRLDVEKNAWSMMISCHAYGGLRGFYEKYFSQYLNEFIDNEGDFETFRNCMKVQEKMLEKVNVIHGVGTDGEGCVYNSTDQKDGIVKLIVLPN